MDVYQRAWASLLRRIEAKTSWGRNELKQQMLEALVEAKPGIRGMPDRDFLTPKEIDYGVYGVQPTPYVDADAVQRKAQNDMEPESAHSPSV